MKLSVIMSVYNGEDYLTESIDSVLCQTHKDFEFIIVNDGSTDNTKKILDQIQDSRVKVIHLNNNLGASYGRNLAIQHATSEWVVLQDDDDISVPSRLEELQNYLITHPGLIAVGSQVIGIPGKITVSTADLLGPALTHNVILKRDQIQELRFSFSPICNGTLMISRHAYLQIGGYNQKYRLAEDYDLFLRLCEIGPIEIVPKILYYYRIDPNSSCRKNWIETHNTIINISTQTIQKIYFKNGITNPSFVIFGTKNACNNYQKNIDPYNRFNVVAYFTSDNEDLSFIHQFVKNNKVKGIISLDAPQSEDIISFFKKEGWELNHNLFRLSTPFPK